MLSDIWLKAEEWNNPSAGSSCLAAMDVAELNSMTHEILRSWIVSAVGVSSATSCISDLLLVISAIQETEITTAH